MTPQKLIITKETVMTTQCKELRRLSAPPEPLLRRLGRGVLSSLHYIVIVAAIIVLLASCSNPVVV